MGVSVLGTVLRRAGPSNLHYQFVRPPVRSASKAVDQKPGKGVPAAAM